MALGAGVANGARHEQQQGRPNPLAASGDDVLRHSAYQWHARIQALRDDAVDLCHVSSDQGKGVGGCVGQGVTWEKGAKALKSNWIIGIGAT